MTKYKHQVKVCLIHNCSLFCFPHGRVLAVNNLTLKYNTLAVTQTVVKVVVVTAMLILGVVILDVEILNQPSSCSQYYGEVASRVQIWNRISQSFVLQHFRKLNTESSYFQIILTLHRIRIS